MRGLGHEISRQTVKNVLVEAGLGPEPHEHPDTWSTFLSAPLGWAAHGVLHYFGSLGFDSGYVCQAASIENLPFAARTMLAQ